MFSSIFAQPFYQDFYEFAKELTSDYPCYLVGGTVRDVLKGKVPRDFDVVVDSKETLQFDETFATKNKFGGWKVHLPHYDVDIWRLQDTWGIKHAQVTPSISSFFLTTFFSIDSLCYDIREDKVILSPIAKRSFDTHIIDLVYPPNPYIDYCVVKSLQFCQHEGYTLSPFLHSYLQEHFHKMKKEDFISFQMRHYKKQLFTYEEAASFVFSHEKKES